MSKYILYLFLAFSSFGAYSQAKVALTNATELKTKLKKQANNTSSISSQFTQKKYVSFMKEPQTSKGEFYYKKSDKMRWEQNNPTDYVLLINEGKLRIKENGKEKKIKGLNRMMDKMNAMLINLINGEILEDDQFEAKYFTKGDTYLVELSPKNRRLQKIVKTIELSFSKKNTQLSQLVFNEKSGDKSIMTFFNQEYNTPIKPTLFTEL